MPPPQPEMWAYGVLVVVLVVAAIDDVCTSKIHNWITYPAIVTGLVGHYFGGIDIVGRPIGVGGAFLGMFVGFVPMFIAWSAGGIGGGDAKLMAAVGSLGGWKFALATMCYGFLAAGLMALFVMLRRGVLKRTLGRVWRFIQMLLVKTRPSDPSSADSPTIPLGLALAVGGAVVFMDAWYGGPMMEQLLGVG